ncbi:uncharacterized protein LOC144435174 [Glandiceps talaboti]
MAYHMMNQQVMKQVLRDGFGQTPRPGNIITVNCTGCLTNPVRKFWSTLDPGQQPFSFKVGVGNVIAGWDEGCISMRQGEIARLIIPSCKGYGVNGFPAWGIPPNAELQFEIELLEIK